MENVVAITETITTTVSAEITTVTTTPTTPAPKYVYNFTFIGDSFKDNNELIMTALKSIGIRGIRNHIFGFEALEEEDTLISMLMEK